MKTHIAFCTAIMGCAALSAPALAACDHADALLAKAYPSSAAGSAGWKIEGDYARLISPEAVACKAWPAEPGLTLVAVPLVEADPAQPDDVRGDVEIIVADSATGKPLARRLEKGMADSDAYRFGDLSLDTARYDIGDGVRAFGVRTEQEASSRVDPTGEQALWLYTFKKGHIERILDGLVVSRRHGENNGDCQGTSSRIERTVSLGDAGPGGYRDLLVDQTETDEVTTKVGDDCKAIDSAGAGKHFVLHFGAGRYAPPPGLEADPNDPGHDLFSLIMMPPADAPAAGSSTIAVKPSFDCAKAVSDVEKAICGDSALAEADSAVAQSYRKLRLQLDAAAASELAADQKRFLETRDDAFGFGNGDPAESLLGLLTSRIKFLDRVRVAPPATLLGHWGNLTGDITVESSKDGTLDVAIDAADPVCARWVCSTGGTGKPAGDVLDIDIVDDGSRLTLSRTGQTLKIEAAGPQNRRGWTPGYCGYNGSVEGTYFPLAAPSR